MAISIVSCKKTFDGLLTNPNYPTPASADVDLYFNQVQLSFNSFFQQVSDYSGQLSRQQYWGGPLYINAYSAPSFDGIWTTAYSSIINNANALIPLAEAKNKFIQAGATKIMEAYTLGTLVDMFNDVPYAEAELGVANTNPKADPGATIYTKVQSLLDDAIVDLAKANAAAVPSDLYYSGSAKNWTTLANTLKLKFYMQTRLVDNTVAPKIEALLVTNNLINSASQDFVFKYGTQNSSPDSRHPHYAADYVQTGGEGEYLSDYFMWLVAAQKYGGTDNTGTVSPTLGLTGDPRLRYYFYRQTTSLGAISVTGVCPCFPSSQYGSSTFPAWYPSVPDQTPYCVVGSKGYYGRDHGDNSGAPPDANVRTAWGIYPAGGQFDANQGAVVTLSMGGLGAGISPIWLSSFTSFLEAEAALSLGLTDNGTARALLTKGVNASISKVTAFPATVGVTPSATYAATATQTTNYVNLVLAQYDAAATTSAQLNVVETEYYIALWGNGIEAYNNLRRTGMPNNLQPAVTTADPGVFEYSFYYPSVYINLNQNHEAQKTVGGAGPDSHVFWDNNPDTFVK